jgi:hypothetical protein
MPDLWRIRHPIGGEQVSREWKGGRKRTNDGVEGHLLCVELRTSGEFFHGFHDDAARRRSSQHEKKREEMRARFDALSESLALLGSEKVERCYADNALLLVRERRVAVVILPILYRGGKEKGETSGKSQSGEKHSPIDGCSRETSIGTHKCYVSDRSERSVRWRRAVSRVIEVQNLEFREFKVDAVLVEDPEHLLLVYSAVSSRVRA